MKQIAALIQISSVQTPIFLALFLFCFVLFLNFIYIESLTLLA